MFGLLYRSPSSPSKLLQISMRRIFYKCRNLLRLNQDNAVATPLTRDTLSAKASFLTQWAALDFQGLEFDWSCIFRNWCWLSN